MSTLGQKRPHSANVCACGFAYPVEVSKTDLYPVTIFTESESDVINHFRMDMSEMTIDMICGLNMMTRMHSIKVCKKLFALFELVKEEPSTCWGRKQMIIIIARRLAYLLSVMNAYADDDWESKALLVKFSLKDLNKCFCFVAWLAISQNLKDSDKICESCRCCAFEDDVACCTLHDVLSMLGA